MESVNICRLCLIEKDDNMDLFNDSCNDIRTKITSIFKFEIVFDEIYINTICNDCIDAIEKFWNFYRSTTENQSLFYKTYDDIITKKQKCLESTKTKIKEHLNSKGEKDTSTNDQQLIIAGTNGKFPANFDIRMTKIKCDEQIREFFDLACNICHNIEFTTFKALQTHYENEHKCKGYIICCDKKIFRKDRLLDHIINHINPDAFTCPTCDQKCKSKILLKIHMKQHLPVVDRPFKCFVCNRCFVVKSQLTNHKASHLSNEQKKYSCDICGKTFALKFVMTKHKRIHSKQKNFVCELCAKAFVTESNFRAHTLTNHAEIEKPRVECCICSSWYKNTDTLRTHMRIHREQNQHICKTCSKKFITKSALDAHMRYVHLNIREFECNLCDRKFRRRLELKEHMARHTGQQLYHCTICPRSFTSSSNYISHKNKHKIRDSATIVALIK